MPATDDQQMEMDMVSAMFDTFEVITEDPPAFLVTLSHAPGADPEVKVVVTYPPEYPDSAVPAIVVSSISATRHVPMAAVAAEVAALAEEHLGMHCITAVLQLVQTYLTTFHEEQEKSHLQKVGREMNEKSKIVTRDPTIRMGNAVTPELFKEWQTKHLAEKAARKALETKKKETHKLTGRQLWDSSLRSADWELFAAGEDAGLDLEEAGFHYDDHGSDQGDEDEFYDLEEGEEEDAPEDE